MSDEWIDRLVYGGNKIDGEIVITGVSKKSASPNKENQMPVKNVKRAKQESLALKELEPVDSVPEKKIGPRNSHIAKVAATLTANPDQWYKIGHGKRASAYQKRMRLKKFGAENGQTFEAEVRQATDPATGSVLDGMSDIFARFVASK